MADIWRHNQEYLEIRRPAFIFTEDGASKMLSQLYIDPREASKKIEEIEKDKLDKEFLKILNNFMFSINSLHFGLIQRKEIFCKIAPVKKEDENQRFHNFFKILFANREKKAYEIDYALPGLFRALSRVDYVDQFILEEFLQFKAIKNTFESDMARKILEAHIKSYLLRKNSLVKTI